MTQVPIDKAKGVTHGDADALSRQPAVNEEMVKMSNKPPSLGEYERQRFLAADIRALMEGEK